MPIMLDGMTLFSIPRPFKLRFFKLDLDCLYQTDLHSPRMALHFSKSRLSKTLTNISLSLSFYFFRGMLDVSVNIF